MASPMKPSQHGSCFVVLILFGKLSVRNQIPMAMISPGMTCVTRSDRYRYALMEWLKHCSIDYLREGLSEMLIDNEMDLQWPCRARGNTTPEATPRLRQHHARRNTTPEATPRLRQHHA